MNYKKLSKIIDSKKNVGGEIEFTETNIKSIFNDMGFNVISVEPDEEEFLVTVDNADEVINMSMSNIAMREWFMDKASILADYLGYNKGGKETIFTVYRPDSKYL